MTLLQFSFLAGLVVIGILVIPWSVERAVDKRWGEIRSMFDRAMMHGGSLDTLSKALRQSSEESKAKSDGAVKAVELMHQALRAQDLRIQRLEEHPLMRPLGGNGPPDGSE